MLKDVICICKVGSYLLNDSIRMRLLLDELELESFAFFIMVGDVVQEEQQLMANAPVSPKGGGPYNMKKTIRTKGRYTDS